MRIDLHVHSRERSACGKSGEEEMIQAAISCGLNGLVFTDHHRLVPPERLEELNRMAAPFRVFGGVEISVADGEDVLVLGVRDPALESGRWSYPALSAFVRGRAGFLILAHPFRYHDAIRVDLERYPVDAIEVRSRNINPDNEPKIRELIQRRGLRPLCNSDAHEAGHVGLHCNRLEHAPQGERELLNMLRAGDYVCHGLKPAAVANREIGRWNEPYWPRIVSSIVGGGR